MTRLLGACIAHFVAHGRAPCCNGSHQCVTVHPQVTLQLHTLVGVGAVSWFVTGRQLASGCELFCVHAADTDEGEVLDAAASDYESLQ
jgi:hypothetical protein